MRTPPDALLNRVRRKLGVLVLDQMLRHPVCTGGLDQQLYLALILQRREKVDRLVDGMAEGEQTVVLEDTTLVARSESRGNVGAFLCGKHLSFRISLLPKVLLFSEGQGGDRRAKVTGKTTYDTSEILVHRLVVEEETRVLGDDVDGKAKGGPSLAMKRVTVRGRLDFRTCMVDRRMDVEARHLKIISIHYLRVAVCPLLTFMGSCALSKSRSSALPFICQYLTYPSGET